MSEHKRVLVIDDEEDIIDLIWYNLKKYNVEIDTALNAKDGLRFLKSNKYDLILTDIAMPEMDGEYFIEQIRENNLAEGVPVVVISAFVDEPLEASLKKLKVDLILNKPIDRKKLLRYFATHLPKKEH